MQSLRRPTPIGEQSRHARPNEFSETERKRADKLAFDADKARNQAQLEKERAERALADLLKADEKIASSEKQIKIESSRSLALQARAELENGRVQNAVEKALLALPDRGPENDRPLVPEAELVLFEALQILPRPQVSFYIGSNNEVTSVDVLPGNDHAVTAAFDGKVRLWSLASGHPGPVFEGSRYALSRDGKLIATANGSHVAVYDLKTNAEIANLSSEVGVQSLSFSNDGKRVGISYGDAFAQVLDVEKGVVAQTLRQPSDYRIHELQFSPDHSRVLAIGHNLFTARVFDLASEHEPARLVGHRAIPPWGLIRSGSFSFDGKRIATGAVDGVRFWDAQGNSIGSLDLGSIQRVAFSPRNQEQLLTVTDDNRILLISSSTDKSPKQLSKQGAAVVAAQFSTDGTQIFVARLDGTMSFFKDSGEQIRSFRVIGEPVASAALSSDGKAILTGSKFGSIQLWDAETRPELAVFQLPGNAVGIQFDRNEISVGRIQDATRTSFPIPSEGSRALTSGGMSSVTSNDKSTRRSVGRNENGDATIFDPSAGGVVARLRPSTPCQIRQVALNAEATVAAMTCSDDTLRLWRVFPTTQEIVDEAKSVLSSLRSNAR